MPNLAGQHRFTLCLVLREVANRWDAVELWVTQLAFPFQVVLAILVVLPLCWGVAGLLDLAVDAVALAGARRRRPRDRDT